MPIPEDLREIFDKVCKATDEGRATWGSGVSPDVVVLALSDFSVQVERNFRTVRRPVNPTVGTTAYFSPSPVFGFKTLDRQGDCIDGFELSEGDGEEFKKIQHLFEMARRNTEDVKGKLSKLKEQLTAKLGA
jgi:hypothetical protein